MRTTEAQVKAIIDTELTEDEIAPFLAVANRMVTALLGDTEVLSSATLTDIETWFAAYALCIRDPRVKSETIDTAKWDFETATPGAGLRANRYGEMVLLLDITGRFAALGSSKRPARLEAF